MLLLLLLPLMMMMMIAQQHHWRATSMNELSFAMLARAETYFLLFRSR